MKRDLEFSLIFYYNSGSLQPRITIFLARISPQHSLKGDFLETCPDLALPGDQLNEKHIHEVFTVMRNVRTILMYSNGLQTTGAVRLPEKDLIHVFFLQIQSSLAKLSSRAKKQK